VPEPLVNIKVFGNKALERSLSSFPNRIQRKVVRQAQKKSLKRLQAHVVRKLSGHPVAPKSGRYLAAMIAAKPHPLPRRRYTFGVGIDIPTREELGIPPDYKKGFYPFSLEYGYTRTTKKGGTVTVPAKAPIRRAVNAHQAEEFRFMAGDIGRGIYREARRHFKIQGEFI
jgi:hypothetical protein